MAASPPDQPNPFVGARPFKEADEGRFFAREKTLAELLGKLGGQDVSLLLAESAAGKSSLLNAGLGPALRRQRLAGLLAADLRVGLPTRFRALPVIVRNWTLEHKHGGQHYLPCIRDAVRESLLDQKRFNDELLRRLQGDAPGLLEELRIELDVRHEDDPRSKRITEADAGRILHNDNTVLEAAAEQLDRERTSATLSGDELNAPQDRGMVNLIDWVTGSIGGDVVLVLDQFEEILRQERDGATASTVISGVQAVSRALGQDVHQLISMREDFFYLLRRAWPGAASWHEDANLTTLTPLQLQEGRLVVRSTLEHANKVAQRQGWRRFAIPDDEFLVRALAWFSAPAVGLTLKQAPLHQLSLNAFLEMLCGEEDGNIDRATFDRVRFRRADGDPASLDYDEVNKNPVLLRNAVLNEHLQRELDALDGTLVKWRAGVCRCLFARVAQELSSSAETKRPVSRKRLEEVGFDEEYLSASTTFLPSGEARVWALNNPDGNASQWAREALFDPKEGCLTQLTTRLRVGNILKPSGAEGTWELVHDGFAAPVIQWATNYRRRPEYFFRWLGAPPTSDIRFPQGENSRTWHLLLDKFEGEDAMAEDALEGASSGPHPKPQHLIRGALLKDCSIIGADFTGVAFRDCDFGQSCFEGCTFSNQDIVKCNFSWALFGSGCSFDSVRFHACTMRASRFGDELYANPMPLTNIDFVRVMSELLRIENGRLDGVRFLRGGLVDLGETDPRATAVRSHGEHGTKALDMVNCTVCGHELQFKECELGAALFDRVTVDPGAGIRFAKVSMRNGFLTKAPDPLELTTTGKNAKSAPSVFVATHCDFTGSVFRSCGLSRAELRGVNMRRVVLRGCDLTLAKFLPTETGDAAFDGAHVPAEQLVMQGCECNDTEFDRQILDRCVVTRCGGRGLIFKNCTLIGAALFDLDGRDDPASPEQVSWWSSSSPLPGVTPNGHLVVTAKASLVDQHGWSSPDSDGICFLSSADPTDESRLASKGGGTGWPWTPTVYSAGPWNSLPLPLPSEGSD